MNDNCQARSKYHFLNFWQKFQIFSFEELRNNSKFYKHASFAKCEVFSSSS